MSTVVAKNARLFISYKPEDSEAAKQIASALEFIGREKLHVSVFEDSSDNQDPFDGRLRELAQADMLLLLYTDPHQDWNACIYESGFFSGKDFPNSERQLIVLHNEDVILPPPLDRFGIALPSIVEHGPVSSPHANDVVRFIRQLFSERVRDELEPIYPDIMNDQRKEERADLANKIIKAMSGLQETRIFVKEISIEVLESSLRNAMIGVTKDMPSDAFVFADRPSFALFGLNENPKGYAWKEFFNYMDSTSDNTQEWADALVHLLVTIAFTPTLLSTTGLPLYRFSSGGNTACYRPAVRSFRRRKDIMKDILSFRIMFIDLPAEITKEEKGAATSLAQVLTLGRMLRTGVLFPFQDRLAQLEGESGFAIPPKTVAEEFEHFIENIATVYVEAKNRGYKRTDLLQYFEPSDLKDRLQGLIKRWDVLFRGSKELADKLRNGEAGTDTVRSMVGEAVELNKSYMILFAEKYKAEIEKW